MAKLTSTTITMPSALTLLALGSALILIRRIYWELTVGASRRKMIRDNGCEPPVRYQNRGVLGKWFGLDVIQEMMQQAKKGQLHQSGEKRNFEGQNTIQHRLLLQDVITTIEPENIKAMLSTKFNDFSLGQRRANVLIPALGHGIFDTDGPAWERSRALVRPNFTRQQVADLDTFETHVQHLIARIPRDGTAVDLQELFFSLTMDSATEFLFGKSTNVLAPGVNSVEAEEFVQAFIYATEDMARQFQSSGLTSWIPNKKRKQAVKTIHRFADNTVSEAIRRMDSGDLEKSTSDSSPNGKPRYVFLHALLSQTRDRYALRSELLNVLLAGRDTTAGLLSNTWHVLARRPDIYSKLRHEINSANLSGHPPTYDQIKDMKYLKYLLNESLRLMPVVPGNTRVSVRDTTLPLGGGPRGTSPIFVPKGQSCNYSVWSMHRRPDFYGPDAREFKPERWENLRPGWEYLPFNGGPRICVGQQFALLEASYTTIRILQAFEGRAVLESRDERAWKEWLTLTLASGTGCWVGFRPE